LERIKDIKNKIIELKKLDRRYSTFGSNRHKYELNKPKTEVEIKKFERVNNVSLPTEYRNFIKAIGNGGAGPYYGLEKIEKGLYADLELGDRAGKVDLSKPFQFTEKWNLGNEEFTDEEGEIRNDLKDAEYFKPEWANGMLRIANFGCGVSINLIVNGEEYGNIWADDRCNDQGILPFQPNGLNRIKFLDWYEQWLEESLNPFNRIKDKLQNQTVESVIKEEWESKNFNIRSYVYNIMDIEPPKIPHHKPEYIVEMEKLREEWLNGRKNNEVPQEKYGQNKWWQIWK